MQRALIYLYSYYCKTFFITQHHTNKYSYDSVILCKSYLLDFGYLSMTTVCILIHIDTHWPLSPIEYLAK